MTAPSPATPSPAMGEWQPIASAPEMVAIWLHHPYYSHGQMRHGYRDRKGNWRGVNADGTAGPMQFNPTHWQPLPEPPEASDG